MNTKNVFEIGGIVLGHELIEKLLGLAFEGVQKHGAKFIQSNILGLGTNDEALFNDACAYAIYGLGADPHKVLIVRHVINSYPRPSKLRIIQIIGKDEQTVTVELPIFDENKAVITDKKGKPIFKKESTTANVRGGHTIADWAKLNSENEIRLAIESSNSNNPMGDKIAEFMSADNLLKGAQAIAAAAGSSYKATKNGFDDIGNNLSQPNAISRLADKFRKKII